MKWNLHIFDIKSGQHEYTEFMKSSAEISEPKEALAYMYGDETLDSYEDTRKGIDYYTYGDSWVGLYRTHKNITEKEIEVLEKFWVI